MLVKSRRYRVTRAYHWPNSNSGGDLRQQTVQVSLIDVYLRTQPGTPHARDLAAELRRRAWAGEPVDVVDKGGFDE